MSCPEILTNRLRLDALLPADAPAMFAYRRLPEVCRYQSFEPHALADVEAFIAGQADRTFDTPGTWYQLAIRLRHTGELLGDLGLHFLDTAPRHVEIGFTIAPDYHRQGYGTEAVRATLGHLFEALAKHRVIASVDPRNEASCKLLARVGFRLEARFQESLWFKGEWVDDYVYALLGAEWPRSVLVSTATSVLPTGAGG